MKNQILLALPLLGAAMALPTVKRSVPREHAHEDILRKVNVLLKLDNPDNIQDAVFGFLGAAAAIEGAGAIEDTDCLQQATADQAFTNAKALGDIDGMTDALIFRAIEKNTGQVGLESVNCESIIAVNPEIAAIKQHQDAAADGAQELNKEIAAELVRQIALIGGDPFRANEASTFAPGDLDDETAFGNGCNDPDDAAGCINSLGLRVDDLSEDEILAIIAELDGAGVAAVDDEDVAAVDNGDFALLGAGCNAAIFFGAPSDGRQQDAFEPADLSLFNHGSALNIAVISNFICSQLSNTCQVSSAAVDLCEQAAAAAQGLAAQAAANAFNAVLLGGSF